MPEPGPQNRVLAIGIAAFPASQIFALLYQGFGDYGAIVAFSFGASLALVAAIVMLFVPRNGAGSNLIVNGNVGPTTDADG